MRQSFAAVLLLATAALSSSNVLPMLSTSQLETDTFGIEGQQNDNTFSNRFNTRNDLNNIFFTVPIGTLQKSRSYQPLDKITDYVDTNNNRAEGGFNDIVNEEDNYDGKGFRKEQWHNYPRQLDRLHAFLFEHHNANIKRNLDDDKIEYYAPEYKDKSNNDIITNEFRLDSNDGKNMYDAVLASTNPLLIFKIHLACLNNGIKKTSLAKYSELQSYPTEFEDEKEGSLFTNEINPPLKVKREGVTPQDTEPSDDNAEDKKKEVKKRLFSLWSRLQSLSHKGHELPHRRHLHAFYGLPDADRAGVLTAETRATLMRPPGSSLMRPPGSPLRWG